jgi:branched-chain amino acid transport system substrate-binding protein
MRRRPQHLRPLALAAGLLGALTLGLTACGGGDGSDSGSADTGSTNLSIYSSLPLQGDARPRSLSIINGEKLALSKAGGRVGQFTIKYQVLDDASAATEEWDDSATAGNARKAAQDKSTIAYLGDADSGATAISVPILNEAGILAISPVSSTVGLTQPGTDKGEPDKYYPSGERSFGRVVPADNIQAAVQVQYQKSQGCTKLYVLNDQQVYGRSLSILVVQDARRQGLEVVGDDDIDPKASNYRDLAAATTGKGADCIFFGGTTSSNAVQLWTDLHAANPAAKLFGPSGVATPWFARRVGADVARVTWLTSPALEPSMYPPAGRQFFKDYRTVFGADADPYAIFGFEAMNAALTAIRGAGDKGNNREAVRKAFFNIRNKPSALGTYSIDANGDISLRRYGGYRIARGALVFDRAFENVTS